ncbi:MAG TPA: hypothetical protein VN868_11825, partial [Terriglobales bacterium]|nr:hypothetical protein [Terriglobales bacterium]
PPPHACCLRKPLHDHGSAGSEFQSAGPGHRNCCPPVTTAQWAKMGSGMSASARLSSAPLQAGMVPVRRSKPANVLHSGRAPPLA